MDFYWLFYLNFQRNQRKIQLTSIHPNTKQIVIAIVIVTIIMPTIQSTFLLGHDVCELKCNIGPHVEIIMFHEWERTRLQVAAIQMVEKKDGNTDDGSSIEAITGDMEKHLFIHHRWEIDNIYGDVQSMSRLTCKEYILHQFPEVDDRRQFISFLALIYGFVFLHRACPSSLGDYVTIFSPVLMKYLMASQNRQMDLIWNPLFFHNIWLPVWKSMLKTKNFAGISPDVVQLCTDLHDQHAMCVKNRCIHDRPCVNEWENAIAQSPEFLDIVTHVNSSITEIEKEVLVRVSMNQIECFTQLQDNKADRSQLEFLAKEFVDLKMFVVETMGRIPVIEEQCGLIADTLADGLVKWNEMFSIHAGETDAKLNEFSLQLSSMSQTVTQSLKCIREQNRQRNSSRYLESVVSEIMSSNSSSSNNGRPLPLSTTATSSNGRAAAQGLQQQQNYQMKK